MPFPSPGFATTELAKLHKMMQGNSKCYRILSEPINTIIYLNDLLASIDKT